MAAVVKGQNIDRTVEQPRNIQAFANLAVGLPPSISTMNLT
ncbi:hypothetical protein CES86_5331 [Brucella lupini]|uniref:Uncharacterized protein n=1 Tax=Brucella lupini TaxID=255457 RepID=A0A256H0N6_9HYPH|nr:hypothetical protein CES86_5331 [Brucella lupini]